MLAQEVKKMTAIQEVRKQILNNSTRLKSQGFQRVN